MVEPINDKAKKEPEATKLVIFLPFIEKSAEKVIKIAAVTDEGKIDPTRNDVIEFSINPESRLRFLDSSKTKQLTLVNGEAKATVMSDRYAELIIFKAKWISGKSPLSPAQVTHLIGSI